MTYIRQRECRTVIHLRFYLNLKQLLFYLVPIQISLLGHTHDLIHGPIYCALPGRSVSPQRRHCCSIVKESSLRRIIAAVVNKVRWIYGLGRYYYIRYACLSPTQPT